jgi:ParB family transcriptional regulator, chromosome partitioning protein
MPDEKFEELDISQISINPYQPRREFNQIEIKELATSISSVGLIQPIIVRKIGKRYELIAGERRLRAAQLAGLTKVSAVIRTKSDAASAEMALIENVQRVDLNPLEVAQALKHLSIECNLNQEELAIKIGKKRSTIANYLRLLSLPKSIQQSISKGEISMGHAKAILSIEDHHLQHLLHLKILHHDLTVRQAEEEARRSPKENEKTDKSKTICPHTLALEGQLQQRLGTKVSIENRENNQGVITINYYNLDDLDRILAILGVVG